MCQQQPVLVAPHHNGVITHGRIIWSSRLDQSEGRILLHWFLLRRFFRLERAPECTFEAFVCLVPFSLEPTPKPLPSNHSLS